MNVTTIPCGAQRRRVLQAIAAALASACLPSVSAADTAGKSALEVFDDTSAATLAVLAHTLFPHDFVSEAQPARGVGILDIQAAGDPVLLAGVRETLAALPAGFSALDLAAREAALRPHVGEAAFLRYGERRCRGSTVTRTSGRFSATRDLRRLSRTGTRRYRLAAEGRGMSKRFDLNDDSVVVVIGSGAGGGTLSAELCLEAATAPHSRPITITISCSKRARGGLVTTRSPIGTWRSTPARATGVPAVCKWDFARPAASSARNGRRVTRSCRARWRPDISSCANPRWRSTSSTTIPSV